MGHQASRSGPLLRFAPYLIFLLLVAPILMGLGMTLIPAFGYLPTVGGTHLSLAPWRALAEQPGLLESIGVSLITGVLTPALALMVVFLFLAHAAETCLDRWIRRLVSPLLSIPHAAAAFGLAFLIAPSGLLIRLLSPQLTGWQHPPDALIIHDPWGLTLMGGLIIKEIPFLLLMSLAALPQLDAQRRVAMARSLGYSPGIAWLKTVAPALYGLVRLPVYAVIAFASSTVEVAIILGPSLPPTLSVQILQWFNSPDLSLRLMASAASIVQLMLTIAALLFWRMLEVLVGRAWKRWIEQGSRRGGKTALWLLGRSGISFTTLVAFAALMTLLIDSFAGFWRFPDNLPGSWTARHWMQTLSDMQAPLWNTLVIGVVATVAALVLVVAVLEHEQRTGQPAARALWLLYLPLIVPQAAFLFGLVVAAEWLGLKPDLALVVFSHLLFVLPYVYLSLVEAYRRLDPRWGLLAHTLGASPNRVFWRIRLPLLLAPCLTAAAVGIAISVSQYLPTLLLGAGRVPTVTIEAVALAAGGDRRIIGVWAVVQALLPMLGFAIALGVPKLLWRHKKGMRQTA